MAMPTEVEQLREDVRGLRSALEEIREMTADGNFASHDVAKEVLARIPERQSTRATESSLLVTDPKVPGRALPPSDVPESPGFLKALPVARGMVEKWENDVFNTPEEARDALVRIIAKAMER